jgi:hypothetical protein
LSARTGGNFYLERHCGAHTVGGVERCLRSKRGRKWWREDAEGCEPCGKLRESGVSVTSDTDVLLWKVALFSLSCPSSYAEGCGEYFSV